MARVWLPPQSDPWLALREPALLVPGRQPVGAVVPGYSYRLLGGYWGQTVNLQNGATYVQTQYGRAIDTAPGSLSSTLVEVPLQRIPHGGELMFVAHFLGGWGSDLIFRVGHTAGESTGLEFWKSRNNGNVWFAVYGYSYNAISVNAYGYSTALTYTRAVGRFDKVNLTSYLDVFGKTQNSLSLTGTYAEPTKPYIGIYKGAYAGSDQVIAALLYERVSDNIQPEYVDPYRYLKTAANEPIFIGTAAGGGGAAALDGTATATATATGALTTQIPIAGAAASVATAAGSITTSIPLAGASAALAAAAGDLSASIRLDGAALAQALATAGLTTAIPLAGDAGGEAAGTGDLTTGGGSAALSGLAQAVATGQADLTIQIRLAGAAVAQAVAAAGLTAPGQGMAGSAQATAAAVGALTTAIPITGGAASVTSADGSLTTIIPLAGAAVSVSSAQGSLDLALPLAGAALAQAVAGGTLTAQIRLSGDAVAAAAASATLAGTELQARPLRGVTAWALAGRSATFKLPSRPNTFRLRRAA